MASAAFVNPFDVNVALYPDMDTIFNTLQTKVTNDGDLNAIWTEAITAATGSYLLRMVSSFTADLSFAVERAQHEVMLSTARRPSSVYAITKNHGVRLQRKIPGSVEVRLAYSQQPGLPAVKTIPPYSQWAIGGSAFFNREAIVFPAGIELQTVNLFRGTVTSDTVISDGSANQSFQINVNNFAVSDADVFCVIGGIVWNATYEGLWSRNALSQVFYDTTTIDGYTRLDFGDSVYGAIPPAGPFTINYIVVQLSAYDAALDLNPTPVNTLVNLNGDTTISGITLGSLSAIQPQRPIAFYQTNAPFIASGRKRASTRASMIALALTYPGVIDCKILGQAEINPKDVRWMNGLATVLLTSSVWGDVDWNQFVAFMHSNSDSTRHFYRKDPVPVVIDYDISAYIASRATTATVEQSAKDIIASVYMLQQGSLGASYAITAIGKKILDGAVDPYGGLITTLHINNPGDVILSPFQYAVLGTVNISAPFDPNLRTKIVNGVTVPGGVIGNRG